jgi:type II secretory pathway component GspD/PulD (secretin)
MDLIVMSRLQEKTKGSSGNKLWLLGNIQLLGDMLFSSRKREESTTELIIFIKPTIILQPQEEAGYLEKRLNLVDLEEELDFYNRNDKFIDSEPFPMTHCLDCS